jgi:TolB-like protein
MASPDVRAALDLQAIVFATISKARDIRHGRLRRPAGRRLAPRLWRAARRMEGVQTFRIPNGFPCYPHIETFSDMGMQVISGGRKIRFGHCTLDDGRGVLLAPNGTETLLRPKTLELLRLFLRNPGRVVGRSEILDAVWPGLFVSDDSITQCVVELRRAMGEVGTALLRTVPRRGYLLQAPVMVEEDQPVSALALLPPVQDDIPSIAVLPFRKFQQDPENAYFADGIVEGIVHVLSGLDRLRVISRGSALALAERTVDPREIGRELGVRYVLYGGVQRAGDRLRISTELSESETGNIIRTDRHDGDMADLFALQDRIAEQAVATITPTVREHELQRALRKPPKSVTAYDLVLQAIDKLHALSKESFDASQAFLIQAIHIDPEYALAHTYQSWWHLLRIAQGWGDDNGSSIESARKAAETALQFDRSDAVAMALRANALGYAKHEFETAHELIHNAVKLSPSCGLAWAFGAAQYSWRSEGAKAVAWAERAVRLGSLDPFGFFNEQVLSQAYYTMGEYSLALVWAERSVAKNPRHSPTLRSLIAAAAALERYEDARQYGSKLMSIEPTFSVREWEKRTPLQGDVRVRFLRHIRAAKLPE